MKKLICVALCVCLAFALSVSCFAEVDPDAYWFPNADGTYGYDTVAYNHDYAADLIASSGVNLDPEAYWKTDEHGTYYYDIDAFNADYEIATAVLDVPAIPDDEYVSEPVPVPWPDDEVVDDEIVSELPLDESLLEVEQMDSVLELGEDTPLVYTVNDLRSSSFALSRKVLTSQDIWGYHKIKANGDMDRSPSGVYFEYGIIWDDGVLYECDVNGNPVSIEHDINIDGKYIYIPSKNVYLDHRFALCDTIPSDFEVSSPRDLWCGAAKRFIYAVDTAIGTFDIEITKYPGSKMYYRYLNLETAEVVGEEVCTVDLEKRIAYFPTLNIWLDEYWQFYNSDPTNVPAVEPDDPDGGNSVSDLKSLIVSIFGEYTPVNTTMAITETVDNTVTTTLVDAVASGAAGVDYEWLAGVFLFGIMLFCLFKLLGGILS